MTSATSATSERGKGMFSKITFLKSVHSSEKDELCPGFEVKTLTKSVHREGVLRIDYFLQKICNTLKMGLKLNLIVHKVAGGGRTDAVQNLSCQRNLKSFFHM